MNAITSSGVAIGISPYARMQISLRLVSTPKEESLISPCLSISPKKILTSISSCNDRIPMRSFVLCPRCRSVGDWILRSRCVDCSFFVSLSSMLEDSYGWDIGEATSVLVIPTINSSRVYVNGHKTEFGCIFPPDMDNETIDKYLVLE